MGSYRGLLGEIWRVERKVWPNPATNLCSQKIVIGRRLHCSRLNHLRRGGSPKFVVPMRLIIGKSPLKLSAPSDAALGAWQPRRCRSFARGDGSDRCAGVGDRSRCSAELNPRNNRPTMAGIPLERLRGCTVSRCRRTEPIPSRERRGCGSSGREGRVSRPPGACGDIDGIIRLAHPKIRI